MNCGCGPARDRRRPPFRRIVQEVSVWAIPAAIWTLIPKCPACIAGFLAVWTGLGLSFTTAAWVRTAALILAGVLLFYLIASRIRRSLAIAASQRQPSDR